MPSTVADENLPPVVMPACEERRILAGQKALVTGGSSGIGAPWRSRSAAPAPTWR